MNRATSEALVSFFAIGVGAGFTMALCSLAQVGEDAMWAAVALVACGIGLAMDQVWEHLSEW